MGEKSRYEPGLKRLIPGKLFGQGVDTPALKIRGTSRQQSGARLHGEQWSIIDTTSPTYGAKEADSIVLRAIALSITCDQGLFLPVCGRAGLQSWWHCQ